MTLTIGILNGITGTGQASNQLPEQQDIVASYQNAVTSDDTQWIDTNASGNYEVEEGHSWLADGVASGTLASGVTLTGAYTITLGLKRFTLGVAEHELGGTFNFAFDALNNIVSQTYIDSVTVDGVVATAIADTNAHIVVITGTGTGQVLSFLGKDTGGTVFSTSNLWNIHIEDLTGVVFSNFLAQDSTDMKMISGVGPDVQFVNGTYSIVEESIEYGHEWSNYSVVADDSKIPADPTSPGKDVLGNPLTNPGTPQKNMEITGYTGTWNGNAYGVLDEAITLNGAFRIEIKGLDITNDNNYLLVGDNSYLRPDNGVRWLAKVDGEFVSFTNVTISKGDLVYSRDDSGNHTLSIGGVSQTVLGSTLGFKMNSVTEAGFTITGSIPQIQIYNETDTITHHWVVESDPTSLQDTIYDIVGGNHATLSGATLPFFTTEVEGSKLFVDGFDNVGGSDGLVPARADGLSATGQPLTNQPTEFIDDYCLFDAPLSVSFYDAAVVAGIDTDLYLAGAAIGLTADEWILLASNPLFFGATKNILVMYNDTQSGDTLDQINDYLGI